MEDKILNNRIKTKENWSLKLGANIQKDGSVVFRVWAPYCKKVSLKIISSKKNEVIEMNSETDGYFSISTRKAYAGSNYYYLLDDEKQRPDPVSRSQPDGVHGASEVVDPNEFLWTEKGWKGNKLTETILYELHVGTFTQEGSFDAAIQKIPHLKKMGITTIELMPVAQFPGTRNWGYDGVGLFAVQNSYGGSLGLKKFINACHAQKIAVCLDVVYNHLGPEGNYLLDFGSYFTKKYHTPWGDALNYDDAHCDAVRNFILSNLLYWMHEYHMDAFRLDAVQHIYDASPRHLLTEIREKLTEESSRMKRKVHLFAESEMNDVRLIQPLQKSGYGIDAQWSDDFHHALHSCLTKEKRAYYVDYNGIADLAKAIKKSFIYEGQYSVFRKKKYGTDAARFSGKHFIHYLQNHDQIGNRAWGDRITTQISFEAQKVSAVLLILLPAIPLLWMGQEYGEKTPFQYFVDHHDANLLQLVRQGRKKEFALLGWNDLPDPADPDTFLNSKLNWKLAGEGKHQLLLKFYTDLIRLRRKMKILTDLDKNHLKVKFSEEERWMSLQYAGADETDYGILLSLDDRERVVTSPFGQESLLVESLNTEDECYGGFLARKKNRVHVGSFLVSSYNAIIGKIEK